MIGRASLNFGLVKFFAGAETDPGTFEISAWLSNEGSHFHRLCLNAAGIALLSDHKGRMGSAHGALVIHVKQ